MLYLLDPFDGIMMQSLREYEGKQFQNVDDPGLELPAVSEAETPEETPEQGAEGAGLIGRFKQVLGERVTEVRESKMLTDSPCRLVSAGDAYDRDLQRVRRLLEQDYKTPPKIMELNLHHPLLRNLAARITAQPDDPLIDVAVEQLFANLLLLEGLHPNPADMVPRIADATRGCTRG